MLTRTDVCSLSLYFVPFCASFQVGGCALHLSLVVFLCSRGDRVLNMSVLITHAVILDRVEVFASISEHASSAFIFASTSSDQFSHASSEHFRNYKWRALRKFSDSWNLSLFMKTLFCAKQPA